MNTFSLSLVLFAGLLHATWNLVAKKRGSSTDFAFQIAVATTVFWFPFIAYLILAGIVETPLNWGYTEILCVIATAILHSIYFVVLMKGYRVAPLTIVYPIARGTGPLISSFAGIFFFNESATTVTVIGILLIVSGVLMLSWNSEKSITADEAKRGVLWGAITGLTISAYTVVDAYAVKTVRMNPLTYEYGMDIVRVFMLLPFISGLRTAFTFNRAELTAISAVSILGPIAYVLVLFAVQVSPLSHVAPIREISLLFGAFFGGKFLQEGYSLKRFAAAGSIALGVICLSF